MAVLIQSGSLNITSAPYGHFDDSGAQQSLLELIALLQLFRDLMVAMRRQLDRLKARIAAKGQQDKARLPKTPRMPIYFPYPCAHYSPSSLTHLLLHNQREPGGPLSLLGSIGWEIEDRKSVV